MRSGPPDAATPKCWEQIRKGRTPIDTRTAAAAERFAKFEPAWQLTVNFSACSTGRPSGVVVDLDAAEVL